ncbi:MAG TPA: pyruvate dehydrogenase complex dihydrolipoamide acetyltransferase [Chthoniobacteraceae bacterium]|nr:pyruvate dehydrogenase complex dihydrolipoamide acetyltransferase [Chthoniobacteraceae bacterium]
MAQYIEMPKLSDTMTEGTLLKWRKNEGDKVETGDIIAEIETDKATMEMEAFDDGILHKHLVAPGEKAAIGSRIAILLQKGEKPPADGESIPESPRDVAAKAETTAPPPGESGRKTPSAATPAAVGGARIKASPLAKKIAAQKGVVLQGLSGSGPGGRIIARDVEGASAGASSKAPTVAPVASIPAGAGDQRLPLSGMRRIIAERLLTSKSTIPHFYLFIEIDAGPLMKARQELNAVTEASGGPKFTINDFVLKAVVSAAQRIPAVNASFAGDAIIQYGSVHLSVAVAVEEGLITPVIRDAQKKSLREISEAVKDLAARARSKKLKPEEYAGGTITVSNLGAYGIESFSAIINPPQALILSVGAIVKKPVVNHEEQIVVGQRMSIGLSADHRVVDGAIGAAYLAELRQLLENPTLMLL